MIYVEMAIAGILAVGVVSTVFVIGIIAIFFAAVFLYDAYQALKKWIKRRFW